MAANVGDVSLPAVIHFLQTESARFERDRNYWELERAEMKAHIARLEGERKGTDRIKNWYLRRLRMMELALQQERLKNDPAAEPIAPTVLEQAKMEVGAQLSKTSGRGRLEHTESYLEVVKSSQQSLRDATGRLRSRTFLEKCLSEITYLTTEQDIQQAADAKIVDDARPTIDELASRPGPDNDDLSVIMPMPIRVPSPPAAEPIGAQTTMLNDTASTNADDDELETERLEPDVRITHVFDSHGQLQSETRVESDRASNLDRRMAKESEPEDHGLLSEVQTTARFVPLQQTSGSLRGHLDKVLMLASTTLDEPWILTAGADETIKIYRGECTEPQATLRAHSGAIQTLVLDSDETNSEKLCFYSAGDDGSILHWRIPLKALSGSPGFTATLLPDFVLKGHSETVFRLAFDFQRLYSVSTDGTVRVWSCRDEPKQLFNLADDTNQGDQPLSVHCLGDPIEDQVAVQYASGQVSFYRRLDGQFLYSIPAAAATHLPATSSLIYLKSGRLLAHQQPNLLTVHDLLSSQFGTPVISTELAISCLALCPASRNLAIMLADGSIQIWDCETWTLRQELKLMNDDSDVPLSLVWISGSSASRLLVGTAKGAVHRFG